MNNKELLKGLRRELRLQEWYLHAKATGNRILMKRIKIRLNNLMNLFV